MSARHAPIVLALFVSACGGESSDVKIGLAPTYDLVGVARVFPNGLDIATQHPVYLTLDQLQSSGGRFVATLSQKGSGAQVNVAGTYDVDESRLLAEPGPLGTLTSTTVELLAAFGARADDGFPRDIIANELTGFIHTSSGALTREASLLGVARVETRPDPPDATRIRVAASGVGQVELTAPPGTTLGSVGLEVFRYQVQREQPGYSTFQVAPDGSFQVKVDGLPEDLYLMRIQAAGRMSVAVVVGADL